MWFLSVIHNVRVENYESLDLINFGTVKQSSPPADKFCYVLTC